MADPSAAMDPTAGAGAPGMDPSAPGTDNQGTEGSGGTVLCTILANADGTYQLVQGDEDEGEGSEDDTGGGTDAQTAGAPMGGGSGGDTSGATLPPETQGQQFDSIGALLKGLLDVLKSYEASASGEGSDQDNFSAGFSGGSMGGAGASSNPIAQKY